MTKTKFTKGKVSKGTVKGKSATGLSAEGIMEMIDGEEYRAQGRPGTPWTAAQKNDMLKAAWTARTPDDVRAVVRAMG